jgi:hypothetical protein
VSDFFENLKKQGLKSTKSTVMRAIDEVKGPAQGCEEDTGVVWDTPQQPENECGEGEGVDVLACLVKCIQDSGVPKRAGEWAVMAVKTRAACLHPEERLSGAEAREQIEAILAKDSISDQLSVLVAQTEAQWEKEEFEEKGQL